MPSIACRFTAVSDLAGLSLHLQALLELAPSIGNATESLGWALAFFAGDEKDAMSLLTLGGWLVQAGTHCWQAGTHCWQAGTHCWQAGTHCWHPEWSTDKC